MNRTQLYTLLIVPAVMLGACSVDGPVSPSALAPDAALNVAADAPSSYVIDFVGTTIPATLAADVEAAGGTLTTSMEEIGVAVAESADPDFRANAATIAGVRSVSPDLMVEWITPSENTAADSAEAVENVDLTAQAHVVGAHETFRAVQWSLDAISAPAAWQAGYQGRGARVAVIDGGIFSTHIDLRGNIDVARSRSFAPGPFNSDVGGFWHGTHVAGIIAARANNFGTVGIAPQATIIGVKALHNGRGAFSWIIRAIHYAATPIAQGGAGANIINMSLGAGFEKNLDGAAQLKNAISKATTYAYQQGVTVIAAAGNSGADLDHTNNLIFVPAQSTHVIAVSATGPYGFGLGATNFDRPASYTNFGQSAISFAGPGGDFAFAREARGRALCSYQIRPSGTGRVPCFVLDMVLSTNRGFASYAWAAGTSMASPAAAGVAALIVGKFGPLHPSHVEARLRASADDLGKPGNDDYYGRGRVNALRAVQ